MSSEYKHLPLHLRPYRRKDEYAALVVITFIAVCDWIIWAKTGNRFMLGLGSAMFLFFYLQYRMQNGRIHSARWRLHEHEINLLNEWWNDSE